MKPRYLGLPILLAAAAIAAAGAGRAVADGQPADSAPAAPAEAAKTLSDEAIAHWIAELDSNRYQVREQATQELLRAGSVALDALLVAANGDRPEPADRAVWILRRLADTSDMAVRRPALERLVQVGNRPEVVAEAEHALGRIRHAEAVDAITRLGGRFLRPGTDVPWGRVVAVSVLIDDTWRGGDEGLKYLGDLRDVPVVVIIGTDISPTALASLSLGDSVQMLQLYGTRLDDAGAVALAKALPGVNIDYRRGALLGVRGMQGDGPALVQSVQPGSAAAAAGIHPDDVIRKFDGQPVADFSQLTEQIAKYRPGDEVALEVQRGGKMLEMKVKLGRWQSL